MNTKKLLAFTVGGVLLVGCLTGYKTTAGSQEGNSPLGATTTQAPDMPVRIAVAYEESDGAAAKVSYEELFKPYGPFGLTYDSGKKELRYQGRTVRWFEDYYIISDGTQAGNDFFNENGVVDVYAVRDFTSFVRSEDGSFDPSGRLVGVKEFSEADFAARDIKAIKNPLSVVAIAGDPPSTKELEDMAKEYEAFGVTYDIKNDQYYFNGEKVRFFWDVLTSNGEGLDSGRFYGAVRTLGSADGSVDLYTVRDFAHPDASGNGTLTGIEKYSQAEFDEHTQRDMQSKSGFCTSDED